MKPPGLGEGRAGSEFQGKFGSRSQIAGTEASANPQYRREMVDSLDASRFPNLVSIETKRFRVGMKGYNVSDVDQFLSALVIERDVLKSSLDAAESEVARLRRQLLDG